MTMKSSRRSFLKAVPKTAISLTALRLVSSGQISPEDAEAFPKEKEVSEGLHRELQGFYKVDLDEDTGLDHIPPGKRSVLAGLMRVYEHELVRWSSKRSNEFRVLRVGVEKLKDMPSPPRPGLPRKGRQRGWFYPTEGPASGRLFEFIHRQPCGYLEVGSMDTEGFREGGTWRDPGKYRLDVGRSDWVYWALEVDIERSKETGRFLYVTGD